MAARTANVSYSSGDNTLVVKSWGNTENKVCKFIYFWTIHNFMLWFKETNKELISPTFPAETNNGLKWNLRSQSGGDSKDCALKFSIQLNLSPHSNKNSVHAKYKLCILSEDNNKFLTQEGFHRFSKEIHAGGDCHFYQATLLNKKNCLLPDDKLTVYCEITTLADQFADYTVIPDCNLSVELGVALATQELSDVTLCVNTDCFKAHKVILSARSSVFRAMFKSKMYKGKNVVVITDMASEVLEEMLYYIYTGEVSVCNTDLGIKLFTAAKNYELKRLKIICEKQLSNNLSKENVIEIYMFADLNDAKQLKTRAKDFIITHAQDVIVTNEWKALVKTHPKLYEEIFNALAAQQIPSTIYDNN